ncbi:uncharacterized protein TNCV_3448931 [Trichonephila clavipes]|nr:uncharacterized protein TNCV_3448931 [Trichonephila clavipes]
MVSDGTEFAVGDIDKWFDESRRNTKAKHEKWAKYYDRRRRDIQIKVNDWVLVKTHPLSSAAQKVIAKFKPKYEGKVTRRRRTSSFDSNSSRYTSSNFDGVQPRSNESQYSRKNGSGERRELEKKGASFKADQGERHTGIASNRRPLVRSSSGSWTEPNRRIKKCKKETLGFKKSGQSGSGGPERKYRNGPRQQGAKRKLASVSSNDLPYFRKRCRGDETMIPSTNGCNLRPRRGHNKEDQFDPEETKNNNTAPTLRSKGQVGVPKAEDVSNSIARRGQEECEHSKIPIP